MVVNTKRVGVPAIVLLVIAISFMLTKNNILLLPITSDIRLLGRYFLYYAYNLRHTFFTALSPAIVNSIVWDYRGIDTFFETSVLYLAIIGSLSIYYKYIIIPTREGVGLSPIMKTVVKIALPILLTVGSGLAIKGHLVPGGAFQGGSIIALTFFILGIIYSIYWLGGRGFNVDKMIFLRSLGLMGIFFTAILVFLIGSIIGVQAFVFQNQPKETAPVGLSYIFDKYPATLVILLFDLFEFLTVMAGFILLFLILWASGYKEVLPD